MKIYISDYQKAKEGTQVAVDQGNPNTKASITNVTAEVENDWQEIVMKLAQAHDVSAKTVHTSLHTDLKL